MKSSKDILLVFDLIKAICIAYINHRESLVIMAAGRKKKVKK